MKLLIDLSDNVYGFMVGKRAYTVAKHGRPFGDLWELGWQVRLVAGKPFCILRYDNLK